MLQRLQVAKWHIMKYSGDKSCRDLHQHRLSRDKLHHYGKGRRSSPCLALEAVEADVENYELQNSWIKWGLSDMMAKDLTWNKILYGYSEKLLKFVLNSNLQTLATPDNLKRWNITKEARCALYLGECRPISHSCWMSLGSRG